MADTVDAVGPARPMRADTRRNYERLLDAARAAFAEHGTDAPLDDIAKRAGVGSGTLYRHFPTRLDLGRVSKPPSAIAGPDAVPDATAATAKDNQYSRRRGGDARNRPTEARLRPPAGADSHRTGTSRHDLVEAVFRARMEQLLARTADLRARTGRG
nr:helix-turn-helix domain-containing protein [Kibdelosporangium sp. MJ126-NF4]CEL13918.1 Transcriptional regulator, TetR family [Kibdelosporangium sp. MJ126-NF4]CTQ88285.1 Transcriptional regulator, TetR family [Kibdelosporangium sp. MJ126-NF4]